jgi:hypothetical protein
MVTEKGTLPGGVEKDGVLHREFEIRPTKVRDTVAVFDDSERAARALKNSQYFAACLFAGRVVSLGTLLPAEITSELILDMDPEDYEEIQSASTRLEERMATFRGTIKDDAQGGTGADETGPAA